MTRRISATLVAIAVVISAVAAAVGPGVAQAASGEQSNFTISNPEGQNLTVSFDSTQQLSDFDILLYRNGDSDQVLGADTFTETNISGGYHYETTTNVSRDGYYTGEFVKESSLNDSAYVDTTEPSVTNVQLLDDSDGDGIVASDDTVRIRADVVDATASVQSVEADASDFGAGTVSLSPASGDTYAATFTVGGSVPADGETNVTIVATDNQSNTNRTDSPSLRLDTNAPTYSSTTLSEAGDDGTVDAGETVTVEADVADATTAIESVTADLSDFGAGTSESLTNETGSSVYNATITVSEGGTTDGDYPVTVRVRDAAGNVNQTTVETLTLNTDPNITSFAVDNSSGQSVDLSFDSDETLGNITVSVSGSDSTTVTEAAFSTADGSAPYTYEATYNAPTDGTYTFTLDEAADGTGKDGASSESETVVVDTTGPNISPLSLTDGDADGNVTDGDEITVEATVSDDTSGVQSVTADLSAFDLGSSVSLTSSDGSTWNLTTAVGQSPTEGDQLASVTATDDEGNTVSADTGTLSVDTSGPSLSSLTLRNGSGGVSVVRDGDTVVVSATVTDTTGITAVTTDASAFGVGTETLSNVGGDTYETSFTVNGTNAAGDGNYSLTVEATDDLGNANSATTNELTQDVNPPTLSAGSLTGTDGDGVVADGETVTVELTVTDATTVETVTADATELGGGSAVSLSQVGSSDVYNGTFVVDASSVADGEHSVSVEAADSQGKTNQTTVGTLTLDTVAPSTSGLSLSDSDADGYVAGGEDLTVSVTPDGTGSEVRTVEADLSAFGAGTVTLADGDSDGTWDVTVSVDAANADPDGSHGGSVTVSDEAGQTSVVTTETLTLDTAKPTLSSVAVTDDADGDSIVADGESVTVSATATDSTAGVQSVTADLSAFGAGVVTLTDTGGGWSKTVTVNGANADPDGDYSVAVDVTDGAGNVRSGTTGSLTLDTTGPTVSSPTLTDETGDGVLTDGENVTVEATATDANGVATVAADLSAIGAGTVTLTDGDDDGTWNATVAVDESNASADGSVSAPIQASDDRGTVGSGTTGSLTLDTTGPSITGLTFTDATDGDGVVAPGDQIDLSATVSDAAGIGSVTVDGSAFGSGSAVSLADGDSDGTYTATLTVDFDATASDGDRSVPVTTTDTVGNKRSAQTGTLTLDTPPTVSNFSVSAGSDSSVDIAFDASETLNDVNVTLTGSANATLDETDFSVSGTSYETSHPVGSNGSVTVTLARLADANGNDGASGQSATISLNGSSSDSNGGGGGGGGGGEEQIVVIEPDPESETDANDSEPPRANVSVERAGRNGSSARVEAAQPSSLVDLPLNTTSESKNVSLDTLSIASQNETYSVQATVHDDAPNATIDANVTSPNEQTVGYLQVDHSVSDRDIDYAVFRFGVHEQRLHERNVSPDQVALYRYHDGTWTELNAILVEKREETYVYNADTPGLSTFAVGRESGGRVAVTNASVGERRVRPGETVTVSAGVTNDGTRAATGYVSLAVDNTTTDTRRVTLGAGDSETETFTVQFDEAGTYNLSVGNRTAGTVGVIEPTPTERPTPTATQTPTATPTATPTETETGVPGFGPLAAILSLFVVVTLAWRRS
ncbi:PGF-pre-PGF domain-containing protein [Halogeometricum borinquense]|uniref:PGF-pre-PGF domain-containing protein n=2 Tax=Halogeometricum borinquense TaxID=60847 RepID=UPI001EF7E497|nr:PGF-pre-PGF domain-containing protein [Halogeometricum borinquense]